MIASIARYFVQDFKPLNMKIIGFFLVISFLHSLPLHAQDGILGVWLAQGQKGDVKIEVIEQDSLYFGKIVWLSDAPSSGKQPKDRNNPDRTLRDRDIVGINMLSDLNYQSGRWIGSIYLPANGRTANVSIKMKNNEELELTISKFGRSRQITWVRSSI